MRDCPGTVFLSYSLCVCVNLSHILLGVRENLLTAPISQPADGTTPKMTFHDLVSQCHRTDLDLPHPLAAALTADLLGAWFQDLARKPCKACLCLWLMTFIIRRKNLRTGHGHRVVPLSAQSYLL
ncbi:hypothetical protein HJG60_007893 [Phyllostomus discolor]|uniref:Uncharacterized protein n=1 Tax=Phyllostomus discolor TaxID=89673 RepID=A0A834BL69_9CHIR|nr:hypothetical protein HJG60_007893 [Phyllostomus discolor]